MNIIRNGTYVTAGCIKTVAYTAAPTLISTIVQRGFEDERFGKIVLGTGMLVSGVMILALNKAPNVPNHRHHIKDRKYKVEQASSPKYLKITRVLVGSLLVCFGLYQIILGVDEFIFQRMCNQKLARAQQAFLDCPESQKLWEEVKARGAFSIECAPASVAPHGGVTNLIQRKILLSRKLEIVEPSLLFELNNLNRSQRAIFLVNTMCAKKDWDYTRSMEALEYEAARDTYRISEACSDRKLWPAEWNIYKLSFTHPTKGWRSAEDWIETQIKTGHAFHYFQNWHNNCHKSKRSSALS